MQKLMFLLFAAVSLLFVGCDNSRIGEEERDQIVRRLAEEYYFKHAPADSGYEFVSLTVIDTITYKDNIAFRREYIQAEIDYNKSMLLIAQQKQDTFPTVNFTKKANEYQDKVDRNTQIMAGIDSLEAALGDDVDKVASYTYLYKLKAKGPDGVLQLKEYYLQTDPGFGVLSLTDNKEDLYPNPGDFPGYREMAGEILKRY